MGSQSPAQGYSSLAGLKLLPVMVERNLRRKLSHRWRSSSVLTTTTRTLSLDWSIENGVAEYNASMLDPGYQLHKRCLTSLQVTALCEDFEGLGKGAGDRDALSRSVALRRHVEEAFGLATELFTTKPEILRCILFDKNPGANWSLSWHQDLNIKLADGSLVDWSLLSRVVTLRLHLDPTPAENGALRVLPGSHLQGVLEDDARRALRIPEVTVEAEPGDVLQMTPLLVHASFPSKKPARRRVVHVDYLIRD